MSVERSALAGAFALVALFGIGCQSAPNAGAACEHASECGGGLVCRFGRCRSECSQNRDCPAGASCFVASDGSGACSLEIDRSCGASGSECARGLSCVGGQCVRTCASASDCPSDGECRAIEGTTLSFCFDARVDAPDSGALDGGASDTGPTQFDGGIDAGADASVDVGVDSGTDAGFAAPTMPHQRVCSGGGFICSIERGGEVDCWGDAKWGALGSGPGECSTMIGPTTVPVPVQTLAGPLGSVDGLACGAEFACAHRTSGEVYCWGHNETYQLGMTVAACSAYALPVAFAAAPEADARILAVDRQACLFEVPTATLPAGRLRCWGHDLGITGTFVDDPAPTDAPVAVMAAGAPPAWVALGRAFACVVTAYGDPYCWGDDTLGQRMLASPRPTWLSSIGTGREHGVALHHTDVAATWGSHRYAQLLDVPDGALLDGGGVPYSPRALDATHHPQLLATQGDAAFTCAILGADAHVECWGENRALQSGVPDPSDAGVADIGHPVRSALTGMPLTNVAALYVGFENACVRLSAPTDLYCWGANDQGQLQADPATPQSDLAYRMRP